MVVTFQLPKTNRVPEGFGLLQSKKDPNSESDKLSISTKENFGSVSTVPKFDNKEKLKNLLPIHIEEYVKENVKDDTILDLFEADEENVDLRTELGEEELDISNKVRITNNYLKERLGYGPYTDFLNSYFRLKVSFERKSRGEFVDINRKERFDQNLQKFGNFANLQKVKE